MYFYMTGNSQPMWILILNFFVIFHSMLKFQKQDHCHYKSSITYFGHLKTLKTLGLMLQGLNLGWQKEPGRRVRHEFPSMRDPTTHKFSRAVASSKKGKLCCGFRHTTTESAINHLSSMHNWYYDLDRSWATSELAQRSFMEMFLKSVYVKKYGRNYIVLC